MRSSFFPHSSQNSQTLNQRKNNTLTFQGGGTESPRKKHPFEEMMDSYDGPSYTYQPFSSNNDDFFSSIHPTHINQNLREIMGDAFVEDTKDLSSEDEHNFFDLTALPSIKSDSAPPQKLNIHHSKHQPPQSPKNELSQLLPDLSLAEIPDQGNSVDTNTGISPFTLHQFDGQISDRTRHTLFSFLDVEAPESQPLQTQQTKAVKESLTKAAPKAFTNPGATFSQLSAPEKATLLTIIANPRHLRLTGQTTQEFLHDTYGYEVSRSSIRAAQSMLEKADAQDVYSLNKWSQTAEAKQEKFNEAVLQDLLKSKGLTETDSLIPFNNQLVYDPKAAASSPSTENGKTSQSASPQPFISSGSHSPKKRKAEQANPNPFQVEVPQPRKAGRKRNPEEQAKILDAIAKDTSITPNQLIHRGLLATRSSANTYIGLMQYFNNDKKEVLDLLSKIPRGGTLPKAKQIDVLNYIASHRNANTYEVMAECKVGHDTVEGFKKHLEACGGNLQTALSTEPAKKRQKK